MSDVTFDFSSENHLQVHNENSGPWEVTFVNTGELSQAGGRLKQVKHYVIGDKFFLTYGDGHANIDVS